MLIPSKIHTGSPIPFWFFRRQTGHLSGKSTNHEAAYWILVELRAAKSVLLRAPSKKLTRPPNDQNFLTSKTLFGYHVPIVSHIKYIEKSLTR